MILAERNFTEAELDAATTDIVSEWFREQAGEYAKHALLIAEWHDQGGGGWTARITTQDEAA